MAVIQGSSVQVTVDGKEVPMELGVDLGFAPGDKIEVSVKPHTFTEAEFARISALAKLKESPTAFAQAAARAVAAEKERRARGELTENELIRVAAGDSVCSECRDISAEGTYHFCFKVPYPHGFSIERAGRVGWSRPRQPLRPGALGLPPKHRAKPLGVERLPGKLPFEQIQSTRAKRPLESFSYGWPELAEEWSPTFKTRDEVRAEYGLGPLPEEPK